MKNTLKMMKKLFVCVFLWSFFFTTLIDLGVQFRNARTHYTAVDFGLNQFLI